MLLGWEPGPRPHLSHAAWGPMCAAWTMREDVAGRELSQAPPLLAERGWDRAPRRLHREQGNKRQTGSSWET